MIVDMALTWRVSIAEGVMVAADDKQLKAHAELEDIPNLQVLKLMESLTSRGYVRRTYTWKHHYWFLTPEGITYLREYLNLPDIIVPNTLKKQAAQDQDSQISGSADSWSASSSRPKTFSKPGRS